MPNFFYALEKIKKRVYLLTLIIIYFIYGLVFLGIIPSTPSIVHYLTVFIQIFVCTVLLIKFHPFREKYELKEFDGEIIFGSAFIILSNLGFAELMVHSLNVVKTDTVATINNVIVSAK
jgi:hypothetical protein